MLPRTVPAGEEGKPPISDEIRKRWAHDRPYEGIATPSLLWKLRSGALKPSSALLVRQELALRSQIEDWDE